MLDFLVSGILGTLVIVLALLFCVVFLVTTSALAVYAIKYVRKYF